MQELYPRATPGAGRLVTAAKCEPDANQPRNPKFKSEARVSP
jgi:hypothetical protein